MINQRDEFQLVRCIVSLESFVFAVSKARQDFRKTLLATSRKLRAEAEKNKKDVEQEIEEEEQRILEQVMHFYLVAADGYFVILLLC